MEDNRKEFLPNTTPVETAADVAAVVASVAPWVGGPISAVLAGFSIGRKFDRIREVLTDMTKQIQNDASEVSKNYVKTEDFQDLLEKTLRLSADERTEEKRKAYAAFIANDIKSPSATYDEKLRILRTLENLQIGHIQLLRALMQEPDYDSIIGSLGSVIHTLQKRLPNMDRDVISDLLDELSTMKLTIATMQGGTITARGAEELQNMITPYGRRFFSFIEAAK